MTSAKGTWGGRLLALAVGVAGLALLAATGCKGPRGTGPASAPSGPGGPGVKNAGPPEAKDQPALQFAEGFLQAVGEGKAKADQLSAAFKKQIAPPRNDAEKKAGYSEELAQAWLDRQGGKGAYRVAERDFGKDGDWGQFRGGAPGKGLPEFFSLRVVKTQADGWKVDWFSRSPVAANAPAADSPELAAAQFAGRAFLDTMLGGNPTLAEAAMSREFKMELAGSDLPSYKELGYNPGFLHAKLKTMKGSFMRYSITAQELSAGKDSATFQGELIGPKNKPFTMKVGKSGDRWLVTELKEG